ncbi:cysteine proteinase [Basidiobolus meristosporus CBS 931.73]|uniref:Cysteine proteinase n=1 Tax=Basidiobolus meristosporus CBS 931.73 TaxID=1314790 RepID=A0A1Y1Z5G2_9FUNG|nr:cysteine proteinase [Basidiobolus meristosporus CBS 931.73]|eukprot:ORY05511.1 cysteine proteinase [Basidiobolus meristosporus CBS 931.73]
MFPNGKESPYHGKSVSELYKISFSLAQQAVQADHQENFVKARGLYLEVAEIFLYIVDVEKNETQKREITQRASAYISRAEQLELIQINRTQRNSQPSTSEDFLTKAKRYHKLGEEKNGLGLLKEALQQYTSAADYYLRAAKAETDEKSKVQIKRWLSEVIDQGEKIKQSTSISLTPKLLEISTNCKAYQQPLRSPVISSPVIGEVKLTNQELEVLKTSSYVNGKAYLPWLEIDLRENFDYSQPFVDPDGPLPLSEKQIQNFGSWQRPSELMKDPTMIKVISSIFLFNQAVVTDCSFVASLCVCAAYEEKFKKQLITACIYPQDEHGRPQYNASGKYMIKLIYNGIPRKVLVDDSLPISVNGIPMCTYIAGRKELWASIIEKAYMKLMGGYDFPGSNSSIDLHALTGWVPEHIFITDKSFNQDSQWKRMFDGQKYGDALITIATGELDEIEADELGLVPTHAYAVLDVREVDGLRLLQVKNPWSHMRWKGDFGCLDEENWSMQLKNTLGYDPIEARSKDDGIFWINFESVCKYFDSIHMNWNPELFTYRYVLHSSWLSNHGPKKDTYNLGYNPQYGLEVSVNHEKLSAVWLLLTKHVLVKEENRDYITLHVYGDTGCSKVYYPEKPLVQGIYVNSPHILIRFNSPPGIHKYTIVLSQHEKIRSLNYTIRTFCMSPFKFFEIPDRYLYEKKVPGQWTNDTAGGNASHVTFMNNPQFKITVPKNIQGSFDMLIMMEAPRTYPINLKLVRGGFRITSVSSKDIIASSGDYRHGFCCLEMNNIEADNYTLIASAYEPRLVGEFILTIRSSHPCTPVTIPVEGAGLFKKILKGEWVQGVSAWGCPNHRNYYRNPKYRIDVKETTIIKIRLQTPSIHPTPLTHIAVYERDPVSFGKEIASSGSYTNIVQGVVTEEIKLAPSAGGYFIIFSTWEPNLAGKFISYVYSDKNIQLNKVIEP